MVFLWGDVLSSQKLNIIDFGKSSYTSSAQHGIKLDFKRIIIVSLL